MDTSDSLSAALRILEPATDSPPTRPDIDAVLGDLRHGLPHGHLAVAAAFGWIRVELATMQGTGCYLDRIPSPSGDHRVYLRDEDALPGQPWAHFESAREAATWLRALADGDSPGLPESPIDDWERTVGSELFELCVEYVDAMVAGVVVEAGVEVDEAAETTPGRERMVWASQLAALAAGGVVLPRDEGLAPAMMRLLAELPLLRG